MIEYIARSGSPEAMNCPAFICDACGEQVTDHGNIFWGQEHPRKVGHKRTTPIYVTHKGNYVSHMGERVSCVRVLEEWFKHAYPDEDDRTWCLASNEVDQFMGHLKFNFQNSFADDANANIDKVEYHAHLLVMPLVPIPASFRRVGKYV